MPETNQRHYTSTRPRGLASWRPQRRTRLLLEQVDNVLAEYATHLPLTCRQIFYRLVGASGYPKDEKAYTRLLEALNRARRAGLVPFDGIRDDGATVRAPNGFDGKAHFLAAVENAAESYRRERQEGQPCVLEIWVEAGGMVPQVARVAHEYSAAVYSSGGFDSLTAKHDAAQRILTRSRPTVVLHLGDFDPSGLAVFDSAADDVRVMVRDLGGLTSPVFRRVAVTPEQISHYALHSAPPKKTDKRGNWVGGTVQAEALSPADLAREIRAAIEAELDPPARRLVLALEANERRQLIHTVRRLRGELGEGAR